MNPDTQGWPTSTVWDAFPALQPSNDMSRPLVGFREATPHNAAGHLRDPPMSLPIPRIDPPPPISEPSPPEEPPHSRSEPYGFP